MIGFLLAVDLATTAVAIAGPQVKSVAPNAVPGNTHDAVPVASAAPPVVPAAAPANVPGAVPAAPPRFNPFFIAANASAHDVAVRAMQNGRIIAQGDPLTISLHSLRAPNWQMERLQGFVNSPQGFGTIQGATVPVPAAQSEALLQEFGCTHVLVQRFQRPQRSVRLAVYSFLTAEGAFGAYSVLHQGASTIVVRGSASSEDDNSLSFWKGRRFIIIDSSSDADEVSKALSSALADQVSAAIVENANLPAAITSLSLLDQIEGSRRFLMGPQGALRYSLPYVQTLQLENSRGAALADYHLVFPSPERVKALAVEYPTAALARDVFSALNGALLDGHKVKAISGDCFLAKLSNSYIMCSQRGARLTVLTGAHHKEAESSLQVLLSR